MLTITFYKMIGVILGEGGGGHTLVPPLR